MDKIPCFLPVLVISFISMSTVAVKRMTELVRGETVLTQIRKEERKMKRKKVLWENVQIVVNDRRSLRLNPSAEPSVVLPTEAEGSVVPTEGNLRLKNLFEFPAFH